MAAHDAAEGRIFGGIKAAVSTRKTFSEHFLAHSPLCTLGVVDVNGSNFAIKTVDNRHTFPGPGNRYVG